MPKLGIIVPYRNRRTHLNHFTTAIKNYFNNSNIDYELVIVEQADKKSFNSGALLNIGVKKAQELEKILDDYLVEVHAPKWQEGITWKDLPLSKINSNY